MQIGTRINVESQKLHQANFSQTGTNFFRSTARSSMFSQSPPRRNIQSREALVSRERHTSPGLFQSTKFQDKQFFNPNLNLGVKAVV
jgi:hypothetical protein